MRCGAGPRPFSSSSFFSCLLRRLELQLALAPNRNPNSGVCVVLGLQWPHFSHLQRVEFDFDLHRLSSLTWHPRALVVLRFFEEVAKCLAVSSAVSGCNSLGLVLDSLQIAEYQGLRRLPGGPSLFFILSSLHCILCLFVLSCFQPLSNTNAGHKNKRSPTQQNNTQNVKVYRRFCQPVKTTRLQAQSSRAGRQQSATELPASGLPTLDSKGLLGRFACSLLVVREPYPSYKHLGRLSRNFVAIPHK